MRGFAEKYNSRSPRQLEERFSRRQMKVATFIVARIGKGNGNREDRTIIFM
jgi:hypothetical protein